MKQKQLLRQWIGFAFVLIGLGFLAWPFLAGYVGEKNQAQSLHQVRQQLEQAEPASVPGQTSPQAERPYPLLYQLCKEYNEAILSNGQEGLTSTESTERFPIDARDFGFAENTIGTIWIPRMEVELPLYLGAGKDQMAKGAAVMGQTSLPLREGSTNTAIAGHRGYYGTAMFRDIQKLQMDDPICITTPWDELVYRVSEIRIVLPEDTQWCRIEEGKQLLSLMTCHPYPGNEQRYIVIAQLTEEKIPSTQEAEEQMAATYRQEARLATLYDEKGNAETVWVDADSLTPNSSEYGAVWSNLMILAEDKMRLVLAAVSLLALLMGGWLVRETVKEKRERDGTP